MMIKFLGLCLLLCVGSVRADDVTIKSSQVLAKELAVEYRLRSQAQDFLTDVTLFDDMGTLGRGIAAGKVVASDTVLSGDEETSAAPDEGQLPGLGFAPSIEPVPVSSVSLEMSHIGLDPIMELQVEILEVQQAILQNQKSKAPKNVDK